MIVPQKILDADVSTQLKYLISLDDILKSKRARVEIDKYNQREKKWIN